jgi:hypothetical protein
MIISGKRSPLAALMKFRQTKGAFKKKMHAGMDFSFPRVVSGHCR